VGITEVVVATIIAVIAVVALAYSFGTGRGLVSRFEASRVALAAAQSRMETLSALPLGATELDLGSHPSSGTYPVQVDGRVVANESWTVTAYTDPATGHPAGTADLKSVTVTVTWGPSGPSETITLKRLFPLP
jgi:type II secretory pathway pseudopilin PulG